MADRTREQIEAEIRAAWSALTPAERVQALREEMQIDAEVRERVARKVAAEHAARLGLELVRQARAPDTNQ